MRGNDDLGALFSDVWQGTGVVRPVRFPIIALISAVCGRLPFGVLVVATMVLTIATAFLLRRLLRDLGLVSPWPDVGAVAFLLYPLGAESALWPSAMHIPLGLGFAIASLRLARRNRQIGAALAALGAYLSVEQLIFALPLATWLSTPQGRRTRTSAQATILAVGVLAAYAIWPGLNERTAVALSDRVTNMFTDLAFYVTFPATSIGLRSIPLAVLWAFPLSLVAIAGGAALGYQWGARWLTHLPRPGARPKAAVLLSGAGLLALANLPPAMTVPHEDSPRVFTPSWLIIAALLAILGSSVRWRRPQMAGVLTGGIAGAAVLSLALSVSVRKTTADVVEKAAIMLSSQVPEGGLVALCDVRRTVVEPAPVGAFATHEFLFEWTAEPALTFHTGRRAKFALGGTYWPQRCPPNAHDADVTVTFDELLRTAG